MKETGACPRRGGPKTRAGVALPGLKSGQGIREAVNAAFRRMQAEGRIPRAARSIGIRNIQGARE